MEQANSHAQEATPRAKAVLKKVGWSLAETRFNTDAEVYALFDIPVEESHRTLVEFQLLRKTGNRYEPDGTAQGHVNEDGKAVAKLPIRKKEDPKDTFILKAKHCSGDWSNGQGTDREVSEVAEVDLEHTQVSGVHFPAGKSFISDDYLKAFCDLKTTYNEWKSSHDKAKIVVYGHTESNEVENPLELSRNRAYSCFMFVIGDVDRWAELAEKERWGTWEQQCMLRALGFFNLKPTGYQGNKTNRAIGDFIAFLNRERHLNINPQLGFTQANIRKELYREYMNFKRAEIELPNSAFRLVSGYPYVGCCAFNRYHADEHPRFENRRAVFVILQESPNFPAKFPCRDTTMGPCESEAGKPGTRAIKGFKCKFYDEMVRVEKAAEVPTYADAYTVLDSKAYVRGGPPVFTATQATIPQFKKVRIKEVSGDFVLAESTSGESLGWTKRVNLGMFYKDTKALQDAALVPPVPIIIDPAWHSGDARKALAKIYNRLGGLIDILATETGISSSVVLAVWKVESGGKEHTPNEAIIRFENHLFFNLWGKSNEALYDAHFKHGGRAGVSGKTWHNHAFREADNGEFTDLHVSNGQALEYQVLKLAISLAGKEISYQCISIGGCQILISNFRMIGYENASEMYEAFQKDERAHVLGFFDFCEYKSGFGSAKGKMIGYLKENKFVDFATGYNGGGQATTYGGLIEQATTHAKEILPS